MSAGALLQLVAIGAQNEALIRGSDENPPVSFFKLNYKRHTNFACEWIRQTLIGELNFGRTTSCVISRNGDLVKGLLLKITLPKLFEKNCQDLESKQVFTNSICHSLLNSVEITIGGKTIDKLYGEWMEIWCELFLSEDKQYGYRKMVGKFYTDLSLVEQASQDRTYYVPLNFWFCKHPGLALPIIALQYHEVVLKIRVNELKNVIIKGKDQFLNNLDARNNPIAIKNAELFAEYVFLDNEERENFAVKMQTYLIEQLQRESTLILRDTDCYKIDLTFNHPCKEIIWVGKSTEHRLFNDSLIGQDSELFSSATLTLNGHERFCYQNAEFFRLVQPYFHHTRVPKQYIYCYSFAIYPEKHQPTGSLNFSRISNASLHFKFSRNHQYNQLFNVYAVNYNILKIVSGMGGLMFNE